MARDSVFGKTFKDKNTDKNTVSGRLANLLREDEKKTSLRGAKNDAHKPKPRLTPKPKPKPDPKPKEKLFSTEL